MQFGTRWQRVTSMAIIWEWKDKVYHDEDKKFTTEDLDETAYAVAYLGLIWSPQIALAIGWSATPLNILEGAIVAGGVASFGIGGLEGVETYVDYINPARWKENLQDPEKVEAFVQASDILLSITNPLHIPTKWAAENLPWNEIFRNRWLTGPALPF